MNKTETIHIRVNPDIKEKSEIVFSKLGINTSYAVSLFLQQVIMKQAIPFDIDLKDANQLKKEEVLIKAINSSGGINLDRSYEKIIHLFAIGDIDYETAMFAIERKIANERSLRL